jgi:hypothetical protein
VSVDWLWHLRGSAHIHGAKSNEAVIESVQRLLAEQRKAVSYQGSDWIEFESPLWEDMFGPNWLAMVIYDRGRIWVEQGLDDRRLRYDLRSLHGFVFCLFGAVMFFAFGAAEGDLREGLKFAAIAFGWLYGANIALALARIPPRFRRVAQE